LSKEKIQTPFFEHATLAEALAAARSEAGENDKIVVFGSFLTVAGAYG
jgi:folylpolyglutamate synthase/dihydropteroate synthase